jgi:hypothetical protein
LREVRSARVVLGVLEFEHDLVDARQGGVGGRDRLVDRRGVNGDGIQPLPGDGVALDDREATGGHSDVDGKVGAGGALNDHEV